MPLAVTAEQRELAEAAAGFASRHAPIHRTRAELPRLGAGHQPWYWPALVGQGLHAVHLAESDGGQGGDLTDLAVVLEQAGYGLLPGAFVPTMLASAIAQLAGQSAARSAVLTELAGGATAAVLLPGTGISATATASGWQLTGRSQPVLGLLSARLVIVGAAAGDETLWLRLDPTAAGVSLVPEDGVDITRDVGRLALAGAGLGHAAVLDGIDPVGARAVAVALQAAEAAGVIRWCLDCAVSHIQVREQFGRLVGSFQAVKHKAAKLFVTSELAIAAAWDAVRSLSAGPAQRSLAVPTAAVVTLGAAIDAAVEAITLLGGIGATWEHDAHLYWRRAMSLAAMTGPTETWRAELGAATIRTRRGSSRPAASAEDDPAFRARVAQVMDEVLILPADDASGRAHGRPERAVGSRRSHLADAGLVAPHWPAPWGLSATPVQQLIVADEYAKRGLVQPTTVIGEWAMAPILAHGTPAQAERFAAATVRGEIVWCQLFSEPGAGSDLAALATTAVPVPGGWRLDGQKVWTSAAHEADWGICLARTDPAAARHKGLSFFLVDMRSAGIEVRPLRQASGQSEFNEVFLTGVFVPDECLVGEPGDGWRLTMTTLSSERLSISATMPVSDEPIRALIVAGTYSGSREQALGVLGEVHARAAAVAALQVRETLRRLGGEPAGAGSSVAKYATAQLHRDAALAAFTLAGPEAAVRRGEDDVAELELHVPAHLIGGGTLEIQLNVIAERILGLPR